MSEVVKIKGVGPVLAAECAKAGFGSVQKIAGAKANELAVVRGVGELRAKSLISAAKILLDGSLAAVTTELEAANTKEKKRKKKNGKKKNSKKKNGKKKNNKKKNNSKSKDNKKKKKKK